MWATQACWRAKSTRVWRLYYGRPAFDVFRLILARIQRTGVACVPIQGSTTNQVGYSTNEWCYYIICSKQICTAATRKGGCGSCDYVVGMPPAYSRSKHNRLRRRLCSLSFSVHIACIHTQGFFLLVSCRRQRFSYNDGKTVFPNGRP